MSHSAPPVPRRPITKVLVANRGEIAVRVIRACHELGIATVAVYSEADRAALHVRNAGEAVCVGPAPSSESYLRGERIIEAALRTGADAIHPGYGFLSENAAFARMVVEAGLIWIGPPASAIEAMGSKTGARQRMIAAGVPVVPGTSTAIGSEEEALAIAVGMGFPVMLKAAAGGGGKGIRKVDHPDDFSSAWRSSKSEALRSFKDDAVYLEKFVENPKHIEIQVLADQHGTCVHLFERDCSVQRRNQKVVEETPCAVLPDRTRLAMAEVAVQAARAVGYEGAGTIEFLYSQASGDFYFLEMNTRLQVEHPVTEMVTGIDLVRAQLRVASGEPLWFAQEDLRQTGHAIEVRIYAEDPANNFAPAPGRIRGLREPGGPWVRVDSGVYAGYEVPIHYDPMVAKLICWGSTREEATSRLIRALREYRVRGIHTSIPFLTQILRTESFVAGDYSTGFLSPSRLAELTQPGQNDRIATIAAVLGQLGEARQRLEAFLPAPVGVAMTYEITIRDTVRVVTVEPEGARYRIRWSESDGNGGTVEESHLVDLLRPSSEAFQMLIDDASWEAGCVASADGYLVDVVGVTTAVGVVDPRRKALRLGAAHAGGMVSTQMPGRVVRILVAAGDAVKKGQPLIVVEAMKMENELKSPVDGVVGEIYVAEGAAVESGARLIRVDA